MIVRVKEEEQKYETKRKIMIPLTKNKKFDLHAIEIDSLTPAERSSIFEHSLNTCMPQQKR